MSSVIQMRNNFYSTIETMDAIAICLKPNSQIVARSMLSYIRNHMHLRCHVLLLSLNYVRYQELNDGHLEKKHYGTYVVTSIRPPASFVFPILCIVLNKLREPFTFIIRQNWGIHINAKCGSFLISGKEHKPKHEATIRSSQRQYFWKFCSKASTPKVLCLFIQLLAWALLSVYSKILLWKRYSFMFMCIFGKQIVCLIGLFSVLK